MLETIEKVGDANIASVERAKSFFDVVNHAGSFAYRNAVKGRCTCTAKNPAPSTLHGMLGSKKT